MTVSKETNESIRYVVLGVGVITVPKPELSDSVLASKINALGLTVSDQPGLKLSVGYASSSVIGIPGDIENALVEVRTCSGGGIALTSVGVDNKHQE